MVLLYPAATCIFGTKEHQYRSFELCHFVLAQGFASQTARQNAVQFRFVRFSKHHHVQRMVRHFTAVSGEVIQTFGQGSLQVSKAANVGIGNFAQLRHVVVKGRLFDVEGFVRTPARQHFDGERAVFGDLCVMLQRIDRVIGGADHFHVHLLHDAACREIILRQQFVTFVPDFIGS